MERKALLDKSGYESSCFKGNQSLKGLDNSGNNQYVTRFEISMQSRTRKNGSPLGSFRILQFWPKTITWNYQFFGKRTKFDHELQP